MPRLSRTESQRLEELEGALGCMASAHVLLGDVRMRIEFASGYDPSLLGPALEDAARIEMLIRRAQAIISSHAPSPRAPRGGVNAEG